MPNSLRCKIKHLCHNGTLTERERDRILKALEQYPCDDAISRKDAIDAMIKTEQDDIEQYGCAIPEGFDSSPAIEALNDLPSVTPQPKMGYWELYHKDADTNEFKCSQCGAIYCTDYDCRGSEYCPDCGARMESEGSDE